MVARLDRNRPLPEASQPRVEDPSTQRALSAIFNSLREVVRYLQPFVQPEKYRPVDFTIGWAQFGGTPAASKRDALGKVSLRGACYRASGALTVMFVLPLGQRPPKGLSFVGISADVICRIDVETDGTVALGSGGVAGTWVSLAGITFDTEA